MNPRQRRAVLLLALAAAGLLGVFALVANYVSEVETQVGDKVVVLELVEEVPANAAIPDSAVRQITIPSRWAPEAAYRDFNELTGQVAATTLQPNAILQEGMLVPPPELESGEREVAVLVDVIASYAGEEAAAAGQTPKPNRSLVIVPGARVIAVGTPRPRGANGVAEQQQQNPGEVVPVTFALTPRQSLKVAHAQTFGSDVRLALLRPGDPSDRTLDESIYRGEDPEKGQEGVR
jgi:pilus assembly protein CpaB